MAQHDSFTVIASAAVVTNCFFFADFCLIGRRRSVLGLVLVDVYFLGRDRHAVPVVEDFEAFAASVRAG